ncbi:MAG: 3-isopropylmalate dehydratase small subunit [Thermodesulfobacteriota bacterium]|nr:3-isopropylmalate dehydratase small subunit [Thermodesulfobacteriota bacterium]
MKQFNGKVLFLDRSDINTDEIIPAKYLTEITKQALKPYLLEDLFLEGFDPQTDIKGCSVVVSRDNFGCGSSREHAPWAFEVNGIHMVIASGFARIFHQNMFNCGMMAVELEDQVIDTLFQTFAGKETRVEVDLNQFLFTFTSGSLVKKIEFTLSDFALSLVKAGGWVEFADKNY